MNFSKNMKLGLISLLTAGLLTTVHAESSYIGYQGVAFEDGAPLVDSDGIKLKITIYESDGTTAVYGETQLDVSVSDKGYFSHNIGSGTKYTGSDWADVVWSDDYKIKVEFDPDEGTNYTDLGTKDFVAVPYAKGAQSLQGENSDDYAKFYDNGKKFEIFMKGEKHYLAYDNDTSTPMNIFNDGGIDMDFMVKGDNNQYALYVDGSTDRIGIGLNNPAIDLAIGDNDTGIKHNSDGELSVQTNGESVMTLSENTVKISSDNDGDATLIIEADGDDNVETDNPYIQLIQDGGTVTGKISLSGSSSDYTNASANALYLQTASTNIEFAPNGARSMKLHTDGNITTDGNLGIGFDGAPVVNLEIRKGGIGDYARFSGDDASGTRGLVFSSSTTENTGDTHTLNASSSSGVLAFSTNGSERMRINKSGNVGIGTTDPAIDLAIGDTDTGLKSGGDGILQLYTNNNARMTINASGYVGIGTTTPSYPLHVSTYTSRTDGDNYYFKKDSGFLSDGGPFNISIKAEEWIGSENGGFVALSDKRAKKDIENIDSSLDMIMQMRPVVYNKINIDQYSQKKEYGFIAQEIEKILPEAVLTDKGRVPVLKPFDEVVFEDRAVYNILVKKDGEIKKQTYSKGDAIPDGEIFVKSKNVNDLRRLEYDTIFTVAVDAIQEQQEIIDTQKQKIQTLESKLKAIEAALKNSGIEIK